MTTIEKLEKKALDQLLSGKSLFGEEGAFAPMLKNIINKALEAELEASLNEEERQNGNKKNGYKHKTLKTSEGEIQINTPQDRHSNFTPQLIKKGQTILADSLEQKILGLYGLGMSLRDIELHIEEIYDMQVSHSVLGQITDRIIPELRSWQSRSLDSIYSVLWLDAIHFKGRVDNVVSSRAFYSVIGLNQQGEKDVLGLYVSESEGAKFWLSVLSDLQNRGLKDVMIVCTDNLSGFSEAIASIYPQAVIQKCIIHQIRNTLKYVASKDHKEFIKDLKTVYKAATLDIAIQNFDQLKTKWKDKYPVVIESWERNWDELTAYFDFTAPIRKIIYTTNTVEGYHRQIRKVTKSKGAFPNDMALKKIIYLATKRITDKWSKIQNWAAIAQQLHIRFDHRYPLDI